MATHLVITNGIGYSSTYPDSNSNMSIAVVFSRGLIGVDAPHLLAPLVPPGAPLVAALKSELAPLLAADATFG